MSSTDETHKVYSMELDDLSWRYNGIQQMIETRSARLMQIDSELADIQKDAHWAECPIPKARADELISERKEHIFGSLWSWYQDEIEELRAQISAMEQRQAFLLSGREMFLESA